MSMSAMNYFVPQYPIYWPFQGASSPPYGQTAPNLSYSLPDPATYQTLSAAPYWGATRYDAASGFWGALAPPPMLSTPSFYNDPFPATPTLDYNALLQAFAALTASLNSQPLAQNQSWQNLNATPGATTPGGASGASGASSASRTYNRFDPATFNASQPTQAAPNLSRAANAPVSVRQGVDPAGDQNQTVNAAAQNAPMTFSTLRATAPATARAAVSADATRPDSLTNPGDTPSQLGVHVHIKDLYSDNNLINTKDLDMMQAAGVKTVRFDVLWSDVEKKPGQFDFSRYDAVMDEFSKRGIKPMIILGFGNGNYPQDQKSSTAAFARYAEATAQHFSNRGAIWELTNEPNSGDFWKPGPNPNEYMAMVREVAPRIRAADPSGQIIAGSTAGTDTDFLVKLFQQGLLDQVDAVSVHPYQAFPNRAPENVKAELDKLRNAVDQYAPGRDFPIVLGEWGYSSANGEIPDDLQASYLVRQSMLAQLHNSPLSIWYDWKGDIAGRMGHFSKEEQFGILGADMQGKPAYTAMQQMTRQLDGLHLDQRLKTDSPEDYVLLFSDGGNRTRLVAWTTQGAHSITVGGQTINVNGAPQYLPFNGAAA